MATPTPLLALQTTGRTSAPGQFRLLPRRCFGTHHRNCLLSWFFVVFTATIFILAIFQSTKTESGASRWTRLNPLSSSKASSSSSTTDSPPTPKFLPYETTSSFHPVSFPADLVESKLSIGELCKSFPHYITQHRVQAVLKIGHGEDKEKLEAQFNSVSACFYPGELLIFSDMDQDIIVGRNKSNVHRAIDVLANLPQEYHEDWPGGGEEGKMIRNEEFVAYDELRDMLRNGTKLKEENDPTRRGNLGWKLDKYKFLGEVERAWEMRPGRDWYVFFETDTYVMWDNLFRFLLGGLDPRRELYMGSPSPGREDQLQGGFGRGEGKKFRTWFANGGPGFVLSRGAMERLLLGGRKSDLDDGGGSTDRYDYDGVDDERKGTGRYTDPPLTLRWLDAIRRDCCGDSVLGWALWKEAGVRLSGMFPMFNVYPAHGVVYTERQWCQPVLTMHKTLPGDMEGLWRWEQGRRKLGRPLLYEDLYDFKSPGSSTSDTQEQQDLIRENWDNTNYDRLARSHDAKNIESIEECTTACEQDPNCLQYMWRGEEKKTCVLMPFINLGLEKQVETQEKNVTDKAEPLGWRVEVERTSFTSGWMEERILKWREAHVCGDVDWLWPSLGRYF